MSSPYKSKAGIQRIWNALFYALDGFAAALKHEDSFRLEVVLALALIPLALSMHIDAVGKALMVASAVLDHDAAELPASVHRAAVAVASVLLVLIVELINSAIEALTDRVSLEKHVLAKRAKDLGSAAVMLSIINAVVIWLMVLFGGAWLPH